MEKTNIGTHLIIDAWDCPQALLNDKEAISQAMLQAVKEGEATLIDLTVHEFSPYGVTATATLAESHIAIHTWPEYGYFAADLFFCGAGQPHKALEFLEKTLKAGKYKIQEIKRGFTPVQPESLQTLEVVHEQV